MKKFFIAVILLGVLLIAGYGIAYIVMPVKSIALEEYGHEVGISGGTAYIVRDESVYYAPAAGTVYDAVSEGDRVSRDMRLCEIYGGGVDAAALRALRVIDDEISRISASVTAGAVTDETAAESGISDRMRSIPELAKSGDIETIRDYKNDINGIRNGGVSARGAELEELTARRARLEESISAQKRDIVSDRSGIFSSYTDGLEEIFTPEKVQTYDPEFIRSQTAGAAHYETGGSAEVGAPVCKVMNNHIWYVLGITDSEHAAILKTADRVTVKFMSLSGISAKGTVEYVSEPDQNSECVYMIQIPSYLDSAFSYRTISADIVIEEYDGFKVPTEAINAGETIGDYFVYATRGSETYKCACDVLYTDPTDGFSIIQSREDAEARLSSMERLIVGER